jgi:hypothetical protein
MAICIKKTLNSFVLIGLMCTSYQSIKAENEIAKGLVVLGAAASVGGILWAVSALTHESDEQIAQRAEREHYTALRMYEPFIMMVEDTLSAGVTASSIEEKTLYTIARYIEQHSFYNALSEMSSASSRLRSVEQNLSYRIIQAQKDHVYDACHSNMKRSAQAISSLCDRMDRTSRIVEPHRSYIQLFLEELSASREYARELDSMQNYQHDPYQQAQAIKRIAMTQVHPTKYPCIKYVNNIERAIDSLSCKINSCAYHYHDRIGWATLLRDTLLTIKGIMVTDPLYSQELHAQRMESLERERKEAAESLLRLEESKVREMHKANRIEQERLDFERAKFCQQTPQDCSLSFNITVGKDTYLLP